jgi:hypothetical protein
MRKWLEKRRYQVLFLDGCHENFAMLEACPTQKAFGGGESTDKEERCAGGSWWPEELPTENEQNDCRARLAENDNTVDYILTHDAPERLMDFAGVKQAEMSTLNAFFDSLLGTVQYKKWFFGRYHRDLTVSPKARCLFTDVVPLEEKA